MYAGKHVCRYLYIAECLPSLRKAHTAQQLERDRHTKTLKMFEILPVNVAADLDVPARENVFVGESRYCMIIAHVLGLFCS